MKLKLEVSYERYTARHAVDGKASSSESAQEVWPERLPWSALGAPGPSARLPRRRVAAAGDAVWATVLFLGVTSAASLPPRAPVTASVRFQEPAESR